MARVRTLIDEANACVDDAYANGLTADAIGRARRQLVELRDKARSREEFLAVQGALDTLAGAETYADYRSGAEAHADYRSRTLKKLINSPETEVKDALAGMAAVHADLIRVEFDPNVIIRRDAPKKGKVGLVAGGGSGHEPLHNGYVGFGMLDAACPGAVFTSPMPDQMFKATQAVDGGAGVLYIVQNYTGDIVNFEMASELARGQGIRVNSIVTNDDVAVNDSLYSHGRRGAGLTVLLEKIVGGAAEAGLDLEQATALAKRVNVSGRSMGMALTSSIVPAAGKSTFQIADDEMEVGIGIHGEPGRERTQVKGADEIAEILASSVVGDLPFKRGDEVLAFVDGMGGTPLIELYVMANAVFRYLQREGIRPTRWLVGSYITSLEMAGCSLTLLKLDAEITKFWDAPVRTASLRWGL